MDFVPHTSVERREMLESIGLKSEHELFRMIPESLKNPNINIPSSLTEYEITELLQEYSEKNSGSRMHAFLGGGSYDHYVPQTVSALISRGDFATAYTPYQAEASQGTLQSIYEFQTMITRLTGMDVANASMYDGASALAEAALMACRATRKEKVAVSTSVNAHYRRVLSTYLTAPGIEVVEIPQKGGATDTSVLNQTLDDSFAACFIQNPNYFGVLEPVNEISEIVKGAGCILGASVYPQSLSLLKPPGRWNADIVIGDLQSVGLPVSYGGPYAGFVACKNKYVRQLPGRLVGRTNDMDGQTGYVLTLQTREQHIRRSKATSNICTNQALCALATTIYMSLMGPKGLRNVAELSVRKAHQLQQRICEIEGVRLMFDRHFFNEFAIELPISVADFKKKAKENQLLPGIEIGPECGAPKEGLLVCTTEKTTTKSIEHYAEILSKAVVESSTRQPATVS